MAGKQQDFEAQLDALLDAAVDAILIIDSHGRIGAFNRAAERMFGYSSDEVLGENVHMLMPQPYREEHDSYISRYLQTGERRIIGIGREVSARRKDGSVFPVYLSVGQFSRGGESHFVGIISDISDRIDAEMQLRQQRERLEHVTRLGTLGEMAAGIAHEINQPLTAIATYANAARRMLAKGTLETETLEEILGKMANQAERAGEIIYRIRALARRQPADQEPADMAEVVTDSLKLAEVDARYHEVRIMTHLAHPLPAVLMNPIQIQQVILNLVRNAIEVGAKTIQIEVVHERDDEIAILVHDDGPGIPKELREEVFNPFFTTRAEGTGMGLSISRSILSAHGGRIEITTSPAGGASFRISLPVGQALEDD